mmetsp:Transcript_60665/g.112537  ORF Transcript_60665/g.112537 Transcript_60665/m.112537 type:complete len:184 (-) Transcript_60665:137-688(-)
MEIRLAPGQHLSELQKDAVLRAYECTRGEEVQGRGKWGRSNNPKDGFIKPGGTIPRERAEHLLRACGRAVTDEDMKNAFDQSVAEAIDFEQFCTILEQVSWLRSLQESKETKILETLNALDKTRSGVLDAGKLRDLLCTRGDALTASEVDKILDGLPKDRIGRISCKLLAQRLAQGPAGLQRF